MRTRRPVRQPTLAKMRREQRARDKNLEVIVSNVLDVLTSLTLAVKSLQTVTVARLPVWGTEDRKAKEPTKPS